MAVVAGRPPSCVVLCVARLVGVRKTLAKVVPLADATSNDHFVLYYYNITQ
jgi:hypothetical protein